MNKLVRQAFTLIELLVVIAIIGILSGLIVVSMSGVTDKANLAKTQIFSNSLRNSLMGSIVSEWKLDNSGKDSWGSNDCTINIAAPSTDCVYGSCYIFNGSTAYASCGSIASTSAGTMMAWIKPSGTYTASQAIMASSSSSGADVTARWQIGANHTSVCAGSWYTLLTNGTGEQIVCSNDVYNSTNFPTNKWALVVITYDGSNVKFYKNGALINTVPQTVSGAGDAQPFAIGRVGAHNGFYYYGSIDEVRIFSSAISVFEIQEDYYAGLNSLLSSGKINMEEYGDRINLMAQQ
jgi:prepilin-type N-terminal cleavage/methylation domain-containing protein